MGQTRDMAMFSKLATDFPDLVHQRPVAANMYGNLLTGPALLMSDRFF
jgi:hypothetical protein